MRRKEEKLKKITKKQIKIIAIIIAIILAGIIIAIFTTKNRPIINEEKKLDNITKKVQQDIEFSNIEIKRLGATTKITGTAKNNRDKTVDIKLEMKLYYQKGELGGTSITEIKDIPSKETKELELSLMGDYTVCDKYEVVALEVIEK